MVGKTHDRKLDLAQEQSVEHGEELSGKSITECLISCQGKRLQPGGIQSLHKCRYDLRFAGESILYNISLLSYCNDDK